MIVWFCRAFCRGLAGGASLKLAGGIHTAGERDTEEFIGSIGEATLALPVLAVWLLETDTR